MALNRTSPACAEIYSEVDRVAKQQHLGFSITSIAETTTLPCQVRDADNHRDSGCYSDPADDSLDGPDCSDDTGSSGSSGSQSSSSDEDRANDRVTWRQDVVYKKHVVSHVERQSPLNSWLA